MPLNLAPHSRFARRWLFDRNRIGGRKSVLKGPHRAPFPGGRVQPSRDRHDPDQICASARKLFWFPDRAAQDFKSAAASPSDVRVSRLGHELIGPNRELS